MEVSKDKVGGEQTSQQQGQPDHRSRHESQPIANGRPGERVNGGTVRRGECIGLATGVTNPTPRSAFAA